MTSAQVLPVLVVPLVLWRVYARVRRNIGRQPWQPRRLIVRTTVIALITLLIGIPASRFTPALVALVGGVAGGAIIAWFGLKLTRFNLSDPNKSYTPNPFIGIGITLLFIGRLAYRITLLATSAPAETGPNAMFQSPLTLAIFGITAGYYIAYSTGVLLQGRSRIAAAA